MVRMNQGVRHGLCGLRRLDSAMDATTLGSDTEHELDAELEAWDWARTAGVSVEDLRLALQASRPTPAFLKAA